MSKSDLSISDVQISSIFFDKSVTEESLIDETRVWRSQIDFFALDLILICLLEHRDGQLWWWRTLPAVTLSGSQHFGADMIINLNSTLKFPIF